MFVLTYFTDISHLFLEKYENVYVFNSFKYTPDKHFPHFLEIFFLNYCLSRVCLGELAKKNTHFHIFLINKWPINENKVRQPEHKNTNRYR